MILFDSMNMKKRINWVYVRFIDGMIGFKPNMLIDNNARPAYVTERMPPPIGWIKCNVDATFNNTIDATNRGWYMRSHMEISLLQVLLEIEGPSPSLKWRP